MFFNSYIFILLFLPLSIVGYFILNHFKQYKTATAFLTVMSLWFYGYFSWFFLLTLLIGITINFSIGRVLYKMSHKEIPAKCMKILEVAGILLNLSYLFVCKYYNFFIDNINVLFQSSIPFLKIALPLGISFYTFQQIAFIVDSYRGETEKYSFLEYVLFMSFFPQIIQGPILSHADFMPQLRDMEKRKVNYENLLKGFYGFSLGLAKKVLIADTLASIDQLAKVDIVDLGLTNSWIALICYSLQLYFDFSGYCDMAYGLGCMFNLDMPVNFNSPYKAVTIADFWDRWHMTLTRFFTKYVYFPLGGSRKGVIRTYVNIMIIFIVSGLWHGSAWNYVVWGIMNGVAMIICRLFKKQIAYIPKVILVICTFIFDLFHMAMFNAQNVAQGNLIIKQCFVAPVKPVKQSFLDYFNGIFEINALAKLDLFHLQTTYPAMLFLVFIGVLLCGVFFMRNTQEKMAAYKPTAWKMGVTIFLLTWSVISMSGVATFLYVNY